MKALLFVQRIAECAAMGAIALTLAVMLVLAVAPQMLAGYFVSKAADRYEAAGLDTSDCKSFRKSPYVTGHGGCLEKPMTQLGARMAGDRSGYSSHEAPPLE